MWTLLLLLMAAYAQEDDAEYHLEREEKPLERVPVFVSKSLAKLVNEDDSISLPCFVDKLEGYVLLWKKGDNILSVAGQVINNQAGRLSLQEQDDGNYLTLANARPSDAGLYVCQISAFQPKEIVHSLKVRTRPRVGVQPRRAVVRVGQTVEARCKLAAGFPLPEITWARKDGRPVHDGQTLLRRERLVLTNVKVEDAGDYVCKADNGFNQGTSSEFRLVVEHPPDLSSTVRFVHGEPGDEVNLTCRARANPEPNITWTLPGQQQQSAGAAAAATLRLTVDNSTLGTYLCTAANRLGAGSVSIVLSPRMAPVSVTSAPTSRHPTEHRLVVAGTSRSPVERFVVRWRPEADVQWQGEDTVVEAVEKAGTADLWTGHKLISGLRPASVYEAEVLGVNRYGEGAPALVRFGTRGAILDPLAASGGGNVAASVLRALSACILVTLLVW